MASSLMKRVPSSPNRKENPSCSIPADRPISITDGVELLEYQPGGSRQQFSIEFDKESNAEILREKQPDMMGIFVCFAGIMVSFVSNNLLLEHATASSHQQLHELSFLLVTSAISVVVAFGLARIKQEPVTPMPWPSFALLGLLNLGSAFFSVVSLRYVIFPVKVLAKACKPVTVMLCGSCMGKRYPLSKYLSVLAIVSGVALFLGGGEATKSGGQDGLSILYQIYGVTMLSISLCFDGGLGAFEDRIVGLYNLQPLDLMYKIHCSNVLLSAVSLVATNQLNELSQMLNEMGYMLFALGLTAAMGQIFIFLTITRYGSLTCSIMGLARKVTTICASIYVYGHTLTALQVAGLFLSVGAMACKPLQEYLSARRNSPTALVRNLQAQFFPDSKDDSRQKQVCASSSPLRRISLPLFLALCGLGIVTLNPSWISYYPLEFERVLQNNHSAKMEAAPVLNHLRKPAVPAGGSNLPPGYVVFKNRENHLE